jgi:hypothetical protein
MAVLQISYFETWVTSKRLHQIAQTGLDILQEDVDSAVIHPYISHVTRDIILSRRMCKEARAGIIPRPDPPAYNSLLRDIKQFVSTLGSCTKTKEVTNATLQLLQDDVTASEDDTKSILIQCKNWLDSHKNFVRKIWKNYWYWDVTASFLYASVQVRLRHFKSLHFYLKCQIQYLRVKWVRDTGVSRIQYDL